MLFRSVCVRDLKSDLGRDVVVSSSYFVGDLCDSRDYKHLCKDVKKSGLRYGEIVLDGKTVKVFSGVNVD